ncbi:tudor domain-containing protein 7A-like [Cimex lectularius]|uniref:Tudor domain-containing protein 7 n=1 Tax=Cimex lectularius TaxID=79782 RepID=A0A8I6S0S1_CIMLE|nr:tudor domain-containing protein 7A-like [Cimex lectularius]
MSEEEKFRDRVISNLRACLISAQGGILSSRLNSDYQQLLGENIPYKQLGFKSLESFLESLPDISIRHKNGEMFVEAVASANSQHITKLVERQKKSSKKSSRKRVPPVRRSNSMWQPPRYRGPPPKLVHKPRQSLIQLAALPPQNTKLFMTLGVGREIQNRKPSLKFPTNLKSNHNSNSTTLVKPQQKQTNGKSSTPFIFSNQAKIDCRPQSESKSPLLDDLGCQTQLDVNKGSLKVEVSLPTPKVQINLDSESFKTQTRSSAQQRLTAEKKKDTTKMNYPSHKAKKNTQNASKYSQSFSLVTVPTNFDDKSYVNRLIAYAHKNSWPTPEFYVLNRKTVEGTSKVICRTSIICCPVGESLVRECYEYSTYPNEFSDTKEALEYVAAKAYNSLLTKNAIQLPETQDHRIIIDRIAQIVSGRNYGVWAFQIIADYETLYGESLPIALADILKNSGVLEVTKLSDAQFIVYDKVHESKKPKQEVQLLPQLVLPEEEIWEVFVTRVCSMNRIVIRLIGPEYSAQYENLATEMEAFYMTRHLPPTNILEVGRYYIHIDSETCSRVMLMEMLSEDRPRVLFIDHGDSEIVARSSLHVIKSDYLNLPGQAIEVYLADLEQYVFKDPPYKYSTIEDIIGKSYVAVVTSRYPISIILNDTSGDTDININELVQNEINSSFAAPQLHEVSQVVELIVASVTSEGDVFVNVPSETFNCLQEKLEIIDNGDLEVNDITAIDQLNNNSRVYFVRGERAQRVLISKIISINEVEVNLIDLGITEQVKIQQLFCVPDLNNIFLNIPPQALKVRLNDVSPSILKNKIGLLQELLPSFSKAIAKVVRVDKLPYVELFKRSYPGNALISVNQTIVFEDQLKPNDNYIALLEKLSIEDEESDIRMEEEKYGLKRPSLPKMGERYFDILVIDCAHPTNFTVQPVKYLQELNLLMDQMKVYYEVYKKTNFQWKSGDLCVVPSKQDDGFWYRAYVVQIIDSNHASVKYFDYGNMDVFPIYALRILEDQFKKLPFVGLNAKLQGIVPKHKDWNWDDCIRIRDLLNYKKFFSVIKGIKTDPANTFSTLSLEIIDTSSETDIDIAHQLVLEGRACYA